MAASTSDRNPGPLSSALHADRADPDLAANLDLFGQFVGSWVLRWTGRDADGREAHMDGELYAGWVLGGRAVQDVWIVPGRGHPDEGNPPGFHGTTIRFYDAAIGAWRSTWIDPPNGRVRRFLGRWTAGRIELVSDEEEPLLRWSFSDIAPDAFTWTGEISRGIGHAWAVQQRMRATRVAST